MLITADEAIGVLKAELRRRASPSRQPRPSRKSAKSLVAPVLVPPMMKSHEMLALAVCVSHGCQHACVWLGTLKVSSGARLQKFRVFMFSCADLKPTKVPHWRPEGST